MGKSFKESLKALEADIQLANTLALSYPRERDGAVLQMRMSYAPAAHLFMFLVQCFDCQLAGTLGLLRILIYMSYADGKTTMSVYERKASIREFYGIIFPSLLQLQRGITDMEEKKQKKICSLRYSRRNWENISDVDLERENECGICMECTGKVVLPNCNHSLCIECYNQWRRRSQSCPFCRNNLKRVNSGDLWICIDNSETVDLSVIMEENLQRLFVFIEKLPLIVPESVLNQYDYPISHSSESSIDMLPLPRVASGFL
ncbi:OLC1v1006210C1 [Oldenlandia corymbosa var. corymbosa]|uniref:OLC1v1006210C1 n=1 Tax=Oldenlandia corymbosa var. corymbosa TaxID=529605 RepID=A0AAV1DGZ5_OLDCO|nr:OLC1v1006210C1 [Oldenlandia corymbosa var. corymbosa]